MVCIYVYVCMYVYISVYLWDTEIYMYIQAKYMSTGLHLNMQGYRDTCLYTELNALTCKITKFIYT